MKPDQIAIATVSTAPKEPLEQRLAAYSAAGFRTVELQLGRTKEWLAQGRRTKDLLNLLESLHLKCCGGFECGIECFSDVQRRRKNHTLLVANARLLAELGGGVMVVGTDGPGENVPVVPYPRMLNRVGKTLAQVARRFPASVSLAVEFNWSPLVKSLRSAVLAAQAARHPRVGILFDTAHYHCTTSKWEDLNHTSGPLIKHVHLNDMLPKPGEHSNCNRDRVLPGSGQGCLDVKGIIRRIEELGYKGYFSLELFNEALWRKPSSKVSSAMYQAMADLCG